MKLINGRQEGFSLIETIVYLGIVTLVLGLTMNLYFNILGARERIRPREIIKGEADFSIERMAFWTQRAESIVAPSDQGERLELEMKNDNLNPVQIEIRDKRLALKKGGNEWQKLTTDRIEVTELLFKNLTPTGSPGVLRITLTLRPIPALGGRPKLELQTTVNIRN